MVHLADVCHSTSHQSCAHDQVHPGTLKMTYQSRLCPILDGCDGPHICPSNERLQSAETATNDRLQSKSAVKDHYGNQSRCNYPGLCGHKLSLRLLKQWHVCQLPESPNTRRFLHEWTVLDFWTPINILTQRTVSRVHTYCTSS